MPSPMNAWSLLYEELKMTEHTKEYYDSDRNRDYADWTNKDDTIVLGGISSGTESDYNSFWEGGDSTYGIDYWNGSIDYFNGITGSSSADTISFNIPDFPDDYSKESLESLKPAKQSRYKYSEEEILKELTDYIAGTYNQHYSAGDDQIQTLDLIEACGDGESFCRSNILKYASRYDKKGTARRDIMKILHYAVLLLHFNDKNAKREIYPQ